MAGHASADAEKIRRLQAGGQQSYAAIATQMGSAKTTIHRIAAQARFIESS